MFKSKSSMAPEGFLCVRWLSQAFAASVTALAATCLHYEIRDPNLNWGRFGRAGPVLALFRFRAFKVAPDFKSILLFFQLGQGC